MKRLALVFGLLLCAVLSIGAFIPWTLSVSRADQALRQLGAQTGLSAKTPKRLSIALLPRPRVEIEGLELRDPAGFFSLKAARAQADLRLLPLLSGRFALASVTLEGPIVDMDLDRSRPGAAESAKSAIGSRPWPATTAPGLAFVQIKDGVLRLHSAARRLDDTVEAVQGRLDWSSPDMPAALTLSARWRGRDAVLTGWLSDPSLLLKGGSVPAKLAFDSDLLSARFDGSLWGGGSWRFEGEAQASAPSVPAFERWIGSSYRLPRAFGAASASGRLVADHLGAAVSDLSLSIAGSAFEGEAAWTVTPGKPVLSATLASESLNLTPFLAEAPRLSNTDGSWSERPLSSITGTMMNLDFRVSASSARLGRVKLSDVGISVLLEDGRLDLIVPEAKAYDGKIAGRLTALMSKAGTTISAKGEMQRVDLGDLLWAADDFDSLSGAASGRFSIDGRGATVAEIVDGLDGSADFSLSDGDILGVDFEQALRRVDKRPLSVGSEIHGGSTSFSSFSGRWTIDGGEAQLDDGLIAGPGARIELSGSSRLNDRSLSLRASAQQAGADGSVSPAGSRLSLNVAGYWDDPRVVLDAEGLVRRSEAAAPLFDLASPASAQ